MTDIITLKGHELRLMQCGTCGVWHAFPQTIYDHCMREGGFWSCPNGHQRGWKEGAEKQEIDQLRRERDRLKQDAARLSDEIDEQKQKIVAAENKVLQIKKRAAAGVCPCCNRTFVNVQRHMKTKHANVVPLVVGIG
jgi:hypothetical protein